MRIKDKGVVIPFLTILGGLTAFSGGFYYIATAGYLRGEKQIQRFALGNYIARYIKEDKELAKDTYRFEIIDKSGSVLVSVHSYNEYTRFNLGRSDSTSVAGDLERKLVEPL